MKKLTGLLLLTFLTVFTSAQANARDYLVGWGPRIGATMDPDQVHIGMHFDLGDIAERVRLQPNVEVGFGNNLTVVSINPEVFYLFRNKNRWTPYAGGGLGINVYNWDDKGLGMDNTETDIGLNLLGGFETRISSNMKFFGELKLGVGDSPDAKITVGLTFLK